MFALSLPSWFFPLVYKLFLLSFLVLTFLNFRKYSRKDKDKRTRKKGEPLWTKDGKQEPSFRPKLDLDIETSPLINSTERAGSDAKPYYLVLDTESFDAIEEEDKFSPDTKLSPIIALSWQVLDQNKNLILEESHIIRREGTMTDKAKAIHLISDNALHQGEDLCEVLKAFAQDLEQCSVLVAHNLEYHLLALRSAMGECAMTDELLNQKSYVCTMMKGLELGFKRRANGERAYPKLDELFAHLYFARPRIELTYRSKTLRDIRLVSASLRRL